MLYRRKTNYSLSMNALHSNGMEESQLPMNRDIKDCRAEHARHQNRWESREYKGYIY